MIILFPRWDMLIPWRVEPGYLLTVLLFSLPNIPLERTLDQDEISAYGPRNWVKPEES